MRIGLVEVGVVIVACGHAVDAFCPSPAYSKLGVARLSPAASCIAHASKQALRPAIASGTKHSRLTTTPFNLAMSLASTAAPTLASSQAAVIEKMKAARSLDSKGYPADMGFDSFTIGDAKGTITAFEAPGKFNVAWCSSLNIAGSSMCLNSITTFCGPLKDVPHLITRTVVKDNTVDLFIDFKPRAYAAYETRQADGGYGEPTSREWFGFKSARDGFAQAFFTPEVESWADAIRSKGSPKPKASGDDLLYRGPLTIDVSLPANDASVALCAKASAEAADLWLRWMDETPALPAGMKVTSTYAYDTKMRAQLFGVMASFYSGLFGDKGRALAAADAGPLDEAYVGGAS